MAVAASSDADGVGRAISIFLDRLLADERLSWAFDGIDIERVQRHTRVVVIAALGGPDLHEGQELRAAHLPLSLRDEHFDAAVDHLLASLAEVGIADSLTAALGARLEPLRRLIVTG
jgi:truncated hemoglobin YjbI